MVFLFIFINYTFSVVATNSIGSGEAGVVMITTPVMDIYKNIVTVCTYVGKEIRILNM